MSEHENLKLDNQLCFALYAATHSLTRAYRSALESSGITYTQYLVMLVLWEKNNISVSKIAKRLELDSATLTPMLRRLETAGLINRKRSIDDERLVEISLTEAGNLLQGEVAQIQHSIASKTELSIEEFNHLKDALHQLAATISGNNK